MGRDTVHIAATNGSLHHPATPPLTEFYALQNHHHMHYVKSLKHKSRVSSPLHYQVIENLRLRGVTELPVVTQILRNSEFLKLPSMPPSLCSAASAYILCGGGHTPPTTSKGRKCSKDTQLQLVQIWQEWERGANVL